MDLVQKETARAKQDKLQLQEQIEYEKESLQRARDLASDQDCRKESLLREILNIEQETEGLQRLHEAEVRKQQEADEKKL